MEWGCVEPAASLKLVGNNAYNPRNWGQSLRKKNRFRTDGCGQFYNRTHFFFRTLHRVQLSSYPPPSIENLCFFSALPFSFLARFNQFFALEGGFSAFDEWGGQAAPPLEYGGIWIWALRDLPESGLLQSSNSFRNVIGRNSKNQVKDA